jgi:hypothetical protein
MSIQCASIGRRFGRGRCGIASAFGAGLTALLFSVQVCSGAARESPAEPTSAPPRLAIPDKDAVRAADALITEIYGDRLTIAGTPDREKLADDLLRVSEETVDAPGKFALLVRAVRFATDAKDLDRALTVQATLAREFDLRGSEYAVAAFQKLAENNPNPAETRKLTQAILQAADQAVAIGDEGLARDLVELARSLVNKRLSEGQPTEGRPASSALPTTAPTGDDSPIAAPLAVLAVTPDDPEANGAVGRYRCFTQNDWDRGLPILRKGNDPVLQSLALGDMACGSDPQQQIEVADAWWDYAGTQPQEIRNTIREHAGEWYTQAIPKLSGFKRLKAEHRVAEYPKRSSNGLRGSAALPPVPSAYPSLDAIVAAIPVDLLPKPAVWWSDADARNKFQAEYMRRFLSKAATCRITIASIEPVFKEITFVRSENTSVGTTKLQIIVLLPRTDPRLNRLKPGQTLTVTGHIRGSGIAPDQLQLNLADCTFLEGPVARPAAESPAAKEEKNEDDPKPEAFTDLASVLAAVPAEFYPATVEHWQGDPAMALSHEIYKRIASKQGTFTVKVASVNRYSELPMVITENEMVGDVAVRLQLVFRGDFVSQIADVKPGDSCVVTGTLGGASIGPTRSGADGKGRMKWLGFNMDNCRILPTK